MKTFIVAICHVELTNYSVEADSGEHAIALATGCWRGDDDALRLGHEVVLGNEFADVEKARVVKGVTNE